MRNQKINSNKSEPCKQAFDYDDDVNEQAINLLREKAEPILRDGKWKIISGDVKAK